MSESHKGIQSGIKHPMCGKHHSKEKLSKHFSIKVIQLDLNGNIIKIWDSIKLALQGVNLKSGIVEVCKGKNKTAGGYKWKYYKEYYDTK